MAPPAAPAPVRWTCTEEGRLGLSFAANVDGQAPCIKALAPGSPAASAAQLRPGLVLLSIQGQSTAGMAFEAIKARLKASPRPLTLTFGEAAADATLGDVTVTMVREGSLGLKFSPIESQRGDRGLRLVRTNPGSQAEDHPELAGESGAGLRRGRAGPGPGPGPSF